MNLEKKMIDHLDHLVLTTANEATCFGNVMKMALQSFIGGAPPVERMAFQFCNQQMNFHIKEEEFEPKANIPTPGP